MRLDRLSRTPVAAAVCGAALLGWSVNGVASVDRDLQARLAPARTQEQLVLDRTDPCERRSGGRREL